MSPCKFCGKTALYTCPRCFATYCGLSCYKSSQHLECSESFYKELVEDETKSRFVSPAERQQFLELLQRAAKSGDAKFGDIGEDDTESDGSEEALSTRVADLDLDKDGNEIWTRLTKQEKDEFNRLIETGEILSAIPKWKPWWKCYQGSGLITEVTTDNDGISSLSKFKRLVKNSSTVNLENDVLLVLCAYCFLCRYFNGDYSKNCDEFILHLIELCPCFDGSSHRPAENASEAVSKFHFKTLSLGNELSNILDDRFYQKIIKDVLIILSIKEKRALMRFFVEIFQIFDDGQTMYTDPNEKKKAFLARKKLEYLAGWCLLTHESCFKSCYNSLLTVEDNLNKEDTIFTTLQQEVEASGICENFETAKTLIEEI